MNTTESVSNEAEMVTLQNNVRISHIDLPELRGYKKFDGEVQKKECQMKVKQLKRLNKAFIKIPLDISEVTKRIHFKSTGFSKIEYLEVLGKR